MVTVDSERCTGCGRCVNACPAAAIRLVKGEARYYAVIDEQECRDCEMCIEVCPEEAIMSGTETVLEGEIVQAETKPMPVGGRSLEVRPAPRAGELLPKAVAWAGAALAFAGREIVPRLAAALLDAWDRRAQTPEPYASDGPSGRSTGQPVAALPKGGRGRHRWRKRGG